jgi:hypothetical protein
MAAILSFHQNIAKAKQKNAYFPNVCCKMSFQDLRSSVAVVFTTSENSRSRHVVITCIEN